MLKKIENEYQHESRKNERGGPLVYMINQTSQTIIITSMQVRKVVVSTRYLISSLLKWPGCCKLFIIHFSTAAIQPWRCFNTRINNRTIIVERRQIIHFIGLALFWLFSAFSSCWIPSFVCSTTASML